MRTNLIISPDLDGFLRLSDTFRIQTAVQNRVLPIFRAWHEKEIRRSRNATIEKFAKRLQSKLKQQIKKDVKRTANDMFIDDRIQTIHSVPNKISSTVRPIARVTNAIRMNNNILPLNMLHGNSSVPSESVMNAMTSAAEKVFIDL